MRKERGGQTRILSALITVKMDNFTHEVLGDVSDEARWLKIFRTKDILQISVTMMSCILMLNIFPKTGFFITLEVLMVLGVLMKVFLGLIKKSTKDYLRGGGVDYLGLFFRKLHYKKSHKVYSLGTEEKFNGRK